MKTRSFLILLLLITGCTKNLTSNDKFFIKVPKNFNSDPDKKAIIYLILEEAVVTKKDIPDYPLIKDKTKIYISKTAQVSFYPDSLNDSLIELKGEDVPGKISKVKFILKSQMELQEIANKTSDFIYLTLGSIKIKDEIAEIGISTTWKRRSDSNAINMSGGGYILQYKKIDGQWIYEKTVLSWIS